MAEKITLVSYPLSRLILVVWGRPVQGGVATESAVCTEVPTMLLTIPPRKWVYMDNGGFIFYDYLKAE